MKKTFVVTLALVFMLGIAGTAFANPYSDVPAGHWAYKAVMTLSQQGIVEGWDGKFYGNQPMTRYEMAAITARALANSGKADGPSRAVIDRLAVEFSKELNDLGVRVAKLEKTQSSVKISGDTRIRWIDADAADGDTNFQQRVRLFINGEINDSTSFTAKYTLANHDSFGTYDGNDNLLYEAYVTHKGFLGGSELKLGRMSQKVGQMGYYLDSTGNFDGGEIAAPIGKVNVSVAFGDAGKGFANQFADADFGLTVVKASTNFGSKVDGNAWYLDGAGEFDGYKAYGVGGAWAFSDDWKLLGDYTRIDVDGDKTNNGHIRLQYKGAIAAVPHSWGAFVEYVKFNGSALETGTMAGISDHAKGLSLGYQNAFMKNMVFEAMYSPDIKASNAPKKTSGEDYLRLQVNYMF